MFSRIHLTYTSATIVAIIAAVIAVAVSFGVGLTPKNIDSIMSLVGLLGAAITIGGGVKTAGLIRSGVQATATAFHFTSATIVAIVGALITVALSFGLKLSQTEIEAITKLVGLLAGGIAVGGALKSQALLVAGIHPGYHHVARHGGTARKARESEHPRR